MSRIPIISSEVATGRRIKSLVDKMDYMTFKSDCLELLKAHSSGTFDIGALAKHAKDLATKYNSIFNPLEVLSSEAVMGFIISLAVDAET